MGEQKTYTIGVILSAFITRAVDGLLEKLAISFKKGNHHLIFMNTMSDLDSEIEAIQFLSDKVDGLLIFSKATDYAMLEDYLPADKPVIFMINKPEGCMRTAITENDYSAIYQGILNLIANGAKKIAFVSENGNSSASQAQKYAYRSALEASGLVLSEESIFTVEKLETFVPTDLFSNIIATGHDAIFSTSSSLTLALGDCLVVYNHNKATTPVPLLGYGVTDINVATAFGIDMIAHSSAQFADLAYQEMLFQLNHPDKPSNKELQLKGTLRMHKYNWLNIDQK